MASTSNVIKHIYIYLYDIYIKWHQMTSDVMKCSIPKRILFEKAAQRAGLMPRFGACKKLRVSAMPQFAGSEVQLFLESLEHCYAESIGKGL